MVKKAPVFLVLAIIGVGILLLFSSIIAGVHVKIKDAKSFPIEDYCLETGSSEIPEEIEAYRASQNGKKLFVTLLLVHIDNQSRYTYEWSDIRIDGRPSFVYFHYTVFMKNNIFRGTSVHGIMIVSDVAFLPAERSIPADAQLVLSFHRPLFRFSKSIDLSVQKNSV